MTVTIRVAEGDWAMSTHVVADIAASVCAAFDAVPAVEPLAIVMELLHGDEARPRAVYERNAAGENIVEVVDVQGNLWARLVFQFAHEYCHVLADQTTIVWDRFTWLEEALCETASLFALRTLSAGWTSHHDANRVRYAPELMRYAADRLGRPEHGPPPGVSFAAWFAEHQPLMEEQAARREDNTVVAAELLPVFEADQTAWRAVRALHLAPRDGSLGDYLAGWASVCPTEASFAPEQIAARLTAGP